MFNKKRKISKFKYAYGKSPTPGPHKFRGNNALRPAKRPNPRIARYKRIFIFLTIVTATIYFGQLAFFSGYFSIKAIVSKTDAEEITPISDEISTLLKSSIGENLLFIDKDEIMTKIYENFQAIEELDISKKLPSTLVIEYKEYPLAANIINESPTVRKSFIVNSIGYSMKENAESSSLPYIRIRSEEPINSDMVVIDPSKLDYILDTKAYFEDKFGLRVIEVEYKKTAREIHLITEKNFAIWIDIQVSYEDQLKKLKKTLVKLDIYNEPLEYIDLRIAGGHGDKIIYKRR